MPQLEIPGVGLVDFPEGMSDADLAVAAGKLHADAARNKPSARRNDDASIADWLPAAGGIVGGIVGATGGPLGAAAGAALGACERSRMYSTQRDSNGTSSAPTCSCFWRSSSFRCRSATSYRSSCSCRSRSRLSCINSIQCGIATASGAATRTSSVFSGDSFGAGHSSITSGALQCLMWSPNG